MFATASRSMPYRCVRVGAEDEPALVERTAGDAERASRQIGQCRAPANPAGAIRAPTAFGERHEGPVRPGAALTRHPQPIDHDHVHLAGLQRNLRGLRRRKLHWFDCDMRGRVEPVVADHVDFPRHRAVAQHADTHGRHCSRARRASRQLLAPCASKARRAMRIRRSSHKSARLSPRLFARCQWHARVHYLCAVGQRLLADGEHRTRLDLDTCHRAAAAGLVGEPDIVDARTRYR